MNVALLQKIIQLSIMEHEKKQAFRKQLFYDEEYPNNESFLEKMWGKRKSPSLSDQVGLHPLDAGFLDFIEQAYDINEVRELRENREY